MLHAVFRRHIVSRRALDRGSYSVLIDVGHWKSTALFDALTGKEELGKAGGLLYKLL